MSTPEEAALYRFGLFEVDSRAGELSKSNIRLRLRGRPIEILLILLANAGEVVTRDELRGRLWPADTFVDFDHGLHSAVNRLRDALGDSADNPRFIETLPRRGYRFIAPVTVVAATPKPPAGQPNAAAEAPRESEVRVPDGHGVPSSAPAQTSSLLAGPPPPASPPTSAVRSVSPASPAALRTRATPTNIAVGVGVALMVLLVGGAYWRSRDAAGSANGKMTIAVLPFENLSGDPQQDYFSDGFTEEMIAELGMLRPDRLLVIGRTTSMLYKGAKKSIGQIGHELGATYLLDGSVRRSGNRVRITAQLVETAGMTNLWAESYERDVTDVLAIQSEVARQISRSLALALAPGTKAPSSNASVSFPAYELYMRGRFFREQATEEGARRAIEYYEQAIEADPNYAAAYAGIADAYRLLGAPGWEVEAPLLLLTKAKAAVERALALDPDSPEAHAVVAMIKVNFDWDPPAAEREIKEALRLNPSFAQAHQYYSSILTTMNRRDEAIAAARRGMELDPLSATASASLGVRYYYANRPAEGIAQFSKTLEVTPGFAVAHWGLAQCYRLQRRLPEQIEQLKSAVQSSGNSAYMRAHLAYGYAVAGERDKASALRREIAGEAGGHYVAPYHLALIAAGLGETDDAVRWLEEAFSDRSGWLPFLAVEPEFDALRQAPGFQRLLARVTPQS